MERTNEGQRGRANHRDASQNRGGEKPGYEDRLEHRVPACDQPSSARGLQRYSPTSLRLSCTVQSNFSHPNSVVLYSSLITSRPNWSCLSG
ncbi:unnamed protein product [Hymenolepis diminuta]|uniref:Uncharacterized protein n=1 Tax=Hymenolepis diminuta TaxID=6216 RepID=A0A564YEL9_HYMDI|nr:unnamed protein product [Hymenolepis diminuta]